VGENAAVSPRRSTVARQILVLQVLVVVVVVIGAVTLAYYDARRSQIAGARDRALAVAVSVADTPQVREALRTAHPSETIQPFAEEVRRDSHTDFVVVMALDRTRYSHPDPSQIGKPFIGDLGTAPDGKPFTQEYTGTLGPSMRAVVPVFADGSRTGRVVALVSVGITMQRIQGALADRLPTIALAAGLVLGTGLLGAWLISRRLRRQTNGLG
jgi:sensor histidine kinase regulating citrate/malate metabolism